MRWKKIGLRDLQLIEIAQQERESVEAVLSRMCDPSYGLVEAKMIVERLREDVLRRGILANHRLNRAETLTQLSTWCDASGRYARGKQYAQQVSRMLFSGHVIPRLVTKDGQPASKAEKLLDTFIANVLSAQDSAVPFDSTEVETGQPYGVEPEIGPPPSSVSLERDLRDHIAYDPSIIEPGLKLKGKEYTIETGRIDVLCEDINGRLVVIELKKDRSSDEVVGQILRYMGYVGKTENRDVRGIIVVGGPDDRLVYAVAPVPTLKIMYYRVHFEITEEPSIGDEHAEG